MTNPNVLVNVSVRAVCNDRILADVLMVAVLPSEAKDVVRDVFNDAGLALKRSGALDALGDCMVEVQIGLHEYRIV